MIINCNESLKETLPSICLIILVLKFKIEEFLSNVNMEVYDFRQEDFLPREKGSLFQWIKFYPLK